MLLVRAKSRRLVLNYVRGVSFFKSGLTSFAFSSKVGSFPKTQLVPSLQEKD